ncbi:thiolase family protein [Opitutus sp. ER46]|uniref:thiolase family protein n=1 Tax=Opitutus sp. ER46 TaxID=2161864 RepID=UPI000D2F936E|nr:thiolase family protein [Opitutus sp. ER46]PTX91217.1 acetyl-CoA C-acyltransferase [Opitutus sp. ER46]
MKSPLYIVEGVRTPFAKAGTTLADADATELGRTAVAALLARTGIDPSTIDDVVIGCVGNPADAANVGRVIALRAGIPQSVPAITVSRNCASGLEAITQAAQKHAAGEGEVFVVGGAESMSNYPLLYRPETARKFGTLARAKSLGSRVRAMLAFRPKDFSPRISLLLGLNDPVCGMNMGETAEVLAREWAISRDQQDEFALLSHQRAHAAARQQYFKDETVPVFPHTSRKPIAVEADNGVRENQSREALAKLRPVFVKQGGSVTPGNSSQITDGAGALLLMSETALARSGLQPLGRIVGYAYAGCDPARMGLGPVYAMSRLEQRTGLRLDQADLVEINEAFAAQVLACRAAAQSTDFGRQYLGRDRELGEIPLEKLNVNGGAIALGHPVGASGARLVLSTVRELRRRKAKNAVVSLCIGGGQGGALWLEAA